MFSKHKKQHNLGCIEGYSHLFLEDFIVVKPRPSGYLAIASNKAIIQNNYTVQENPGFPIWISMLGMCLKRFLSFPCVSMFFGSCPCAPSRIGWSTPQAGVFNQSPSAKAVGCWAWLVHKWTFFGKNNGKQSRTDLGKETISFTKSWNVP